MERRTRMSNEEAIDVLDGDTLDTIPLQKRRIQSFDHSLRGVYQKSGTSEDILKDYLTKPGLTVIPQSTEHNKVTQGLKAMSTEGFVHVSKSLGVVGNFKAVSRPENVVCEVLLIRKDKPTSLFVECTSSNKEAERYLPTLAKCVKRNILKFIDEQFSLVYGQILSENLTSTECFLKELDRIETETKDQSVDAALYMSPEKYKKVVEAYLCSIMLTEVVIKKEEMNCFLTGNQFRVIIENIEHSFVRIKIEAYNVLFMIEVANRLEKNGRTLLVLNCKDEAYDRAKALCSKVMLEQDFLDLLRNGKLDKDINNVVTHVYHQDLNFTPGSVWLFQYSEEKLLCFQLQKLREMTKVEISNNKDVLPKISTIGEIIRMYKEGMTFVTVTGGSGTGKTAVCVKVLDELNQLYGYEVFCVQTPRMYNVAAKVTSKKIILLSNIFGTQNYVREHLAEWQDILHHLMCKTSTEDLNQGLQDSLVLFSGSKKGIEDLLPYQLCQNLTEKHRVVDLSGPNLRSDDKVAILDHHLQKYDLHMSVSAKDKICHHLESKHGFVHSCEIFANLRKNDTVKDHANLKCISDPLKFIENVVNIFMRVEKLKNNADILRQIIREGGSLDSEPNDFVQCHPLMMKLFLRQKGDMLFFSHPAIHARVACTIANSDSTFLADLCTTRFNAKQLKYVPEIINDNLHAYVTPSLAAVIAPQISELIRKGNLSPIQYDIMQTPEICKEVLELAYTGYEESLEQDRSLENDLALNVACKCQNKAAVEYLLSLTPDVNVVGLNRRSPLHNVCDHLEVNSDILNSLLQKGADVNLLDEAGKTPFHLLCESSTEIESNILSQIVPSKEVINHFDKEGNTAFHYYCQRSKISLSVLMELVEKGTNVRAKDQFGKSPLFYLCGKQYLQKECIKYLLSVDDASSQDLKGNTAIFYLLKNFYKFYRKEILEDVVTKTQSNLRPSIDTHLKVFQMLLQKCKVPFKPNKAGTSILMYICEKGLVEHLKVVVDVNRSIAPQHLKTLLQIACSTGRPEPVIVGKLLERNANILETDRKGQTALHLICQPPSLNPVDVMKSECYEKHHLQENRNEIANLLLVRRGAKNNKRMTRNVQSLSSSGVFSGSDINSTASELKCDKRSRQISGKNLHKDYGNMTDHKGRTAFHLFCINNQSDFAGELYDLLKSACDVSFKDNYGFTGLHYLVLNGYDRYIEDILTSDNVDETIDHGTVDEDSIDCVTDLESLTPLHLASLTRMPKSRLVQILLKHGADPNRKDNRGRTALEYINDKPIAYRVDRKTHMLQREKEMEIDGWIEKEREVIKQLLIDSIKNMEI